MILEFEKTLVDRTMAEEVIGPWRKVKGFGLSTVAIKVPVFKITLNVMYGPYDEFKRFILHKFDHQIKHGSANAIAVTFEHEKVRWNFINIQSCNWTAEEYGTLAHELHHTTHFALEDLGAVYGSGGEEVYAYLQGYLMELVVRAFVQLRKVEDKKKKK